MKLNRYSNFVRSFAYRPSLDQDSDYSTIRFPIYLGILSYRICFVAQAVKDKVANAKTLEELTQFSIVQGQGWVDNNIIRSVGFEVNEVSGYESMFKTTAINRSNLFCRGIYEYPGPFIIHSPFTFMQIQKMKQYSHV